MVTVDQRVQFTTAFITNHTPVISDEDLKQDLYLAALEAGDNDSEGNDYQIFADMVNKFDEIIHNHVARKEMHKEHIISIGVGKMIPIDILSVPDDLSEFLRLMIM